MLNRLLEDLYLRAYAKNLARSYRSDPVNAASDAQIQISTLILIVTFILFLAGSSLFFPAFLQRFFRGGDLMYGILLAVTLAVVAAVNWRFKGYEQTPELTQPYATLKSRRWSSLSFWGVMALFLVVAWMFLGPWKGRL